MGFDPALVSDMIAFDKPVVGVIYPKRTGDLDPYCDACSKGRVGRSRYSSGTRFYLPASCRPNAETGEGISGSRGCGTGLLLIRRDCITQMLKKLPELIDRRSRFPKITEKELNRLIRAFDNLHVDGKRLSEDYSFCHRWRRLCGGEIWANVNHTIAHVGLRHFDAKFIRS